VVSIRATAFAVTPGAPLANRLLPAGRPQDYLLCPACAETVDAYLLYLQSRHPVLYGGVAEEAR
jgi:hypothetical protein